MTNSELEHLTLLAEIDTLLDQLRLVGACPGMAPCSPLRRADSATCRAGRCVAVALAYPIGDRHAGRHGHRKKCAVNAIVGAEVTQAGRERPTTRRPTLVCHSDCRPDSLGFDTRELNIVTRDLATLAISCCSIVRTQTRRTIRTHRQAIWPGCEGCFLIAMSC